MVDIFNKNKSKAGGHIISATSEIGQTDKGSVKDVIVHVMPKRFFMAKPDATKAKTKGVIVIFGGAVALLAGLAFLYFYFSESEQTLPIGEKEITVSVSKKATTTSEKTDDRKQKAESRKQKADDKKKISVETNDSIATSTEPKATSTVDVKSDQATSTKKIIHKDTATSTSKVFKAGVDSDNDGLTDIEEVLLDCDKNSKDSDGDGYTDLSEILNLYNPAGDGKIIVNANIEKYVNNTYNYSLYYPYVWLVDKAGGDDSIIFQLAGGQFIQIIIEQNTEKESLENWYKEQLAIPIIKSEQIVYKKGWQGFRSEDGLIVYLTKLNSDYIFILSYNPGVGDVLNYKNIFEMMVKSLEIGNL